MNPWGTSTPAPINPWATPAPTTPFVSADYLDTPEAVQAYADEVARATEAPSMTPLEVEPMPNEVQLEPGWLARDVERASERVAGWQAKRREPVEIASNLSGFEWLQSHWRKGGTSFYLASDFSAVWAVSQEGDGWRVHKDRVPLNLWPLPSIFPTFDLAKKYVEGLLTSA